MKKLTNNTQVSFFLPKRQDKTNRLFMPLNFALISVLFQALLLFGYFWLAWYGSLYWQIYTVLFFAFPLLFSSKLFSNLIIDGACLLLLFILLQSFASGWLGLTIFFIILGVACSTSLTLFALPSVLLSRPIHVCAAALKGAVAGWMFIFASGLLKPWFMGGIFLELVLASLGACLVLRMPDIFGNTVQLVFPAQETIKLQLGDVYLDLYGKLFAAYKKVEALLQHQEGGKGLLGSSESLFRGSLILLQQGNELFESLRLLKYEDLDFVLKQLSDEFERESEPELYQQLQDRQQFLLQKKQRIEEMKAEEKKLHNTVENTILKFENIHLGLLGQNNLEMAELRQEIELLTTTALEYVDHARDQNKAYCELK